MYDIPAIAQLRRVLEYLESGSSLADSLWGMRPGEKAVAENLLENKVSFNEAQCALWKIKHMLPFLQTLAKDVEFAIRARANELHRPSCCHGLQSLPDSVVVAIIKINVSEEGGLGFRHLNSISKVSKRFLLLVETTPSLWASLCTPRYAQQLSGTSVDILRKWRNAPLSIRCFGISQVQAVSNVLHRCRTLDLRVEIGNRDYEWQRILAVIRSSSSPDLARLEELRLSNYGMGLAHLELSFPLPNVKHFEFRGLLSWSTECAHILPGLTTLRIDSHGYRRKDDHAEMPMHALLKALEAAKNLESLQLSFSEDSVTHPATNAFDTSNYRGIEINMPLLTELYLGYYGSEKMPSPFRVIPWVSGTLDAPSLHTLKIVYGCYDHLPPDPRNVPYALFPTRSRLSCVRILDLSVHYSMDRFTREPKTVTERQERQQLGAHFDRYLSKLVREMPLLSEMKLEVPFVGRLFHFVDICPDLYSLEYQGKLINDMDTFADLMERIRDWEGKFGRCVVHDDDHDGRFPYKDSVRFKGRLGHVDVKWTDRKTDKTRRRRC